jgi:hypothetical protein
MGGRCRRRVGRRETGGKLDPRTRLDWTAHDHIVAGQGRCGRDRIRTCVGNAGDFTGRSAGSPRVPCHPRYVPTIAHDVRERPADSSAVPWRPHPSRPIARDLASGGGKLEGTPDHQPQPHRPAPSRYQGHAPRAQRTGLRPSWRLTDSVTKADGAWVSPFGTTVAPIGCPIPHPRQGWDRGE